MDAYIIDAVRTPRSVAKDGKGALAQMHPQHLTATVLKAIKDRNSIDTRDIGDIIWGVGAQVGGQGGSIARMAALDADYDVTVSGSSVERFCGSSLTAATLAAAQIMAGLENLMIAGGTEMMSKVNQKMQEQALAGLDPTGGGPGGGNARLQAKYPQSHQGVCADAIAAREGIGRERPGASCTQGP